MLRRSSDAIDYGVNGPFAGLFVGRNFQFNNFVAGLEADWQWSNLIGDSQTLAPLGAARRFPAGPFTISTALKDDASIRGRLGVAFDRFLVFGTGRWPGGILRRLTPLSEPLRSPPMAAIHRLDRGGGVDYAFTDNVFGRIEYRYTNFRISGFVTSQRIGRRSRSLTDQ